MQGIIQTMYFSPTHTSRDTARTISEVLSHKLPMRRTDISLTAPDSRDADRQYGASDILVFAFPVYGGRLPAFLEHCIKRVKGDNTPAIIAAVYGNRDFDDALLEAADLLTAQGFLPVAAAAFLGEHSMTAKVAAGRPDEADFAAIREFAARAAVKLLPGSHKPLKIPGQRPYKERGPAAPAAPKTSELCTSCGICAKRCPMGIIHTDAPAMVDSGCIRCNACVKSCPAAAKYFDDERSSQIAAMLESKFIERKEPVFFL